MNGLVIQLIWKDEDLEEFNLEISNGIQACKLHMYENIENIREFGRNLSRFPAILNDVVPLEMGDDRDYSCYILLEAMCYNHFGHAALRIRAKNNYDIPKKFDLSFYLPCEVAAINDLGKALISWDFENNILEWYPKS
jgi:hypothetical protein